MNEMTHTESTQGAKAMKKSLFVTALAVALVFAFSATAFAVGPFFLSGTTGSNSAYAGYLSWNYIKGLDAANNAGTPHGGYTTTSNKCQVCHATHRAVKGGAVLTAIPAAYSLNTGAASPNGYTKGCGWCHNVGGFATSVSMSASGTISPHSNCNRCHTASPHGVGVSEYEVLAERLINEEPDLAIEKDETDGNNNLAGVDFDNADDATALTLGTGYLCNVCHSGGSASTVGGLTFAVNAAGAAPARHAEGTTTVSAGVVTGHRVTAVATTTWNQSGAYNAFYTGGGVAGATSQIAWAPSSSCQTCHDAKLSNGEYSFPHGYTGAGTYVGNVNGAAYIWMNTASSAAGTKTELSKNSALANQANMLLSEDGLCLKCHVATDAGTKGVGLSF
jgi:hypothetical protein